MLYRGMDRAALDRAYNNQAAVAAFASMTAQRRERSARLRQELRAMIDLAYGARLRQCLDFFPAQASNAPLLVFIHGGYWQGGDKASCGFLAEGPVARGFAVAVLEYTVAPEGDMPGMLAEVRQALRWLVAKAQALGFDEKRIVLAGHSAGAQLLCMAMDEVRARAGIAISGLYDLEPIRLCYLNDKLRLTPACVKLFSPASHVRAGGPRLIVTVGAGELPELVRQSADYAAACGDRAQYLPLAGHDHFSVLDELAAFEGRLCQLLVPLAAQTRSKTR